MQDKRKLYWIVPSYNLLVNIQAQINSFVNITIKNTLSFKSTIPLAVFTCKSYYATICTQAEHNNITGL